MKTALEERSNEKALEEFFEKEEENLRLLLPFNEFPQWMEEKIFEEDPQLWRQGQEWAVINKKEEVLEKYYSTHPTEEEKTYIEELELEGTKLKEEYVEKYGEYNADVPPL